MRIRLQLLLPLVVGLLVALGFVWAAAGVGDAVRDALSTVPGLTRERAVESAVRAVMVGGVVATAGAAIVAAIVARMIVVSLSRMGHAARRTAEREAPASGGTPVAEIQDAARGVTRVTGELRDRHGRAAREQADLAALVEAVSEGILQLTGTGRIVRMNRAAGELLRLPDQALGRPLTAMVRHPELRRLLMRGAAGEAVEPGEVVVDDRRLMVVVAPQPEGGAVATVMDLTDLRRLEEVRRDFVANASHELKTPLTSIRGYAETLRDGDLDADARRDFLDIIARNAERLQRIVDDLLDLSRLESGGWQPALQPLDLLEAARDAWRPFADRAAAQEVAFTATAGDEAAGPHVHGLADPRAVAQVFANLFDNALRYTPAGGRVAVRVAAREAAPGGDVAPPRPGWIVVEVADTGAGIPRDALPRVFERFFRVDPARSRAEGGTGLGLSIVRHMVERMGGAVTADSTLGRGTTVTVWLPRARPGA